MKCLSLTNPWGPLMAFDEKRFETRGPTFPRTHVGELTIAASKSWPREYMEMCREEPFPTVLYRHGITTLRPLAEMCSQILCVVDVVGYCNAEDVSRAAALGAQPAEYERELGNYAAGRTIILTRNVRRLREPVPVAHLEKGQAKPGGALGIFELPAATAIAVRERLEVRRG